MYTIKTNKPVAGTRHLESERCTLRFLLATQLKVLAAFEGELHLVFTNSAFQTQDNLLRRFCLLMENGLGLPSVTRLFTIVSALPLYSERVFSLLVLRHFVWGVLSAVLVGTICPAGFGNVNHLCCGRRQALQQAC